MKSHSHCHPNTEPPEDWGDGSWTVDCVCGVTFDDGEEMVSCDECGVWVHTRCSRFVKGETSFNCEKCKNQRMRKKEREETEVAQLLVELPTKTLRLDMQHPHTTIHTPPFRLWTDIPIEERVHVQGVPGDPSLLQGLSSIFSSELWKCTGYIPKKFNFQYREFPCWEENEIPVDRGADALFCLSKETSSCIPCLKPASNSMLPPKVGRGHQGGTEKYPQCGLAENYLKGENNHLQTFGVQPVSRNDEWCDPKDKSSKKKSRIADKDKERSKSSVPVVGSFKSVFRKDGSLKQAHAEFHVPNDEVRENTVLEFNDDAHIVGHDDGSKLDHFMSLKVPTVPSAALTLEIPQDNIIPVQNIDEKSSETMKISNKSDTSSLAEASDSIASVMKKEDIQPDVDDHLVESYNMQNFSRDSSGVAVIHQTNCFAGAVGAGAEGMRNTCSLQDSYGIEHQATVQTDCRVECHTPVIPDSPSCVDDKMQSAQRLTVSGSCLVEPVQELRGGIGSGDHEMIPAINLLPGLKESYHSGDELKIQKSLTVHEVYMKIKHGAMNNTGLLGFAASRGGSQALGFQKLVTGTSKSSTASSTMLPAPDNCKQHLSPDSDATPIPFYSPQQCEISADDREHLAVDVVKIDNAEAKLSCGKNISHMCEISDSPPSISGVKDKNSGLFKDRTQIEHIRNISCPEHGSAPGSSSQSENIKSNSHPSLSSVSSLHSKRDGSASARISDEELALLLHQELNSSARVARVPRLQHGELLPQLASPPSTTRVFMRRHTSSHGKENTSYRRTNKEGTCKDDGSQKLWETVDGRGGADKTPFSPDRKELDPVRRGEDRAGAAHDFMAEDIHIQDPEDTVSGTKSVSMATTISSRCLSSTEPKGLKSTLYSSSSDASDDDMAPGNFRQTLPGLIDQILSKGRRMTYRELCDTVLPHWNNLRKQNGERYAYSSHSQAVSDCLRNRSEWSQLVVRGTKTNSGRKRRKLNSVSTLIESKNGSAKDGSLKMNKGKSRRLQHEGFPKGKRKARKRRRIAPESRGVRDVRRPKAGMGNEDDDEGLSSSSEGTTECFPSDEEREGAQTADALRNNTSTSSSDKT